MAKRIVASCDNVEAHQDELVEATEVVLSIGGPPLGLDLCPDCRKALLGPLEGLLGDHGQPLGEGFKLPTRATRGPYKGKSGVTRGGRLWCPVPGCGFSGVRSAIHSHARQSHDSTMAELEGRHGRLLADGRREVLEIECPVKTCEARYSDPRGLSVHMRNVHPDN